MSMIISDITTPEPGFRSKDDRSTKPGAYQPAEHVPPISAARSAPVASGASSPRRGDGSLEVVEPHQQHDSAARKYADAAPAVSSPPSASTPAGSSSMGAGGGGRTFCRGSRRPLPGVRIPAVRGALVVGRDGEVSDVVVVSVQKDQTFTLGRVTLERDAAEQLVATLQRLLRDIEVGSGGAPSRAPTPSPRPPLTAAAIAFQQREELRAADEPRQPGEPPRSWSVATRGATR